MIVIDQLSESGKAPAFEAWVLGEREQEERIGWEIVEELLVNAEPLKIDGWMTLAEMLLMTGHTSTDLTRRQSREDAEGKGQP